MALNINQVIKWDALKAAIDKMSDRLARKNGYYSTLTAGAAERLIVCDNVESQFFSRGTGGIAEIAEGVALIDKMRGNSMVWNQLVNSTPTETRNGITMANNADGSYTFNGTAEALTGFNYFLASSQIVGHCYLYTAHIAGSNETYFFDGMLGRDLSGNGVIGIASSTYSISFYIMQGQTLSNVVIKPQVFDLTRMFGTTANAAAALGVSDFNSNENKTAAINEFKERYPLDYYAYNAGTLVSFNGNTNGQIQSTDSNGQNASLCTLPAYTLRGIGNIKDEIEGNVLTRRIGVVDLGTLNWEYAGGSTPFFHSIVDSSLTHKLHGYQCLSSKFENGNWTTADNTMRLAATQDTTTAGRIYISCHAYTSAAAFKTAMNGVYLLYELATPTTQTISEWDNSYDVYPNGTEALIPTNGTTPHTTIFDGVIDYTIDAVEVLRNINEDFVSTKQSQGLSTAKQANARNNISVYSKAEVDAMIVTALNDNY